LSVACCRNRCVDLAAWADSAEVDDDLVQDMTEILTSMCARLYGKARVAGNHAQRALVAGAATPQRGAA
jgi:predicted site-specific integrase-resolvase